MPKHEPITNTLIPQEPVAPIPERVAKTRDVPRQLTPKTTENGNQADTNRNAPAAEPAPTAESVKLSPQLSALARKEQAFRQREQAQKQREKDLESDLALAREYKELKAKLSTKDFSEAEKLGLNYEEYTKYLLDKQNGEDPNAKSLNEVKAEIAALKQSQEEQAEQQFEETKAAYGREIASLVASNPEFSSIKELKAEGHVLQLFVDTWLEEENENYTIEDACKEIEAALVEQGKKFSSLAKLKPAQTEERQQAPLPKPGMRTLTNQMVPSGTEQGTSRPLHKMSNDAERYAEARRRVLARRQQGA